LVAGLGGGRDLPPRGEGEFGYLYTLIGKRARTTDGRQLGTVEELIETAARTFWSFATTRRELLVPAVRALLLRMDGDRVVLESAARIAGDQPVRRRRMRRCDFDVLTIFPEFFGSPLRAGIVRGR
jgi:hypothetical protein